MDNARRITPANIDAPRLGDRAGFLFGLIPVGRSADRHRAARLAAEDLARTDPGRAYGVLERLERLLLSAQDRDQESDAELGAVLRLHASLLRQDGRDYEAASLLLLSHKHGALGSDRESFSFLADCMARTADDSEDAIRIYLEHLADARSASAEPSPSAYALLGRLAVPPDPLDAPSAPQRDLLSRIAAASPSCGLALFGQASIAYHEGRFHEANGFATRDVATSEFPGAAGYVAHMSKAHEALSAKDFESAAADFERASLAMPGRRGPLLGIATAAVSRAYSPFDDGREVDGGLADLLTKGKEAASSAAELAPGDSESLHLLGRLCLVTNELGRAVEVLQQAVKILPRPGIMADLARAYRVQGDLQAALDVASRAVQIGPRHPGGLCALGDVYSELQDWSNAADAYLNATEIEPDSVAAMVGAGRALAMQWSVERAMPILERAVSTGSRSGRYWLARTHLRAGMAERAAQELLDLCSHRPSVEECFYAASALAQTGRMQDALPILAMAEQMEPGNGELLVLSAQIHTAIGQTEKAVDRLRRAEGSQPECPGLHYANACAAYRRGDVETALRVLGELREEEPSNGLYLQALSQASLSAGDMMASRMYAERCLAIDPDDVTARTLLSIALARESRFGEIEGVLGNLGGDGPTNSDPQHSEAVRSADGATTCEHPDAALWLLGRSRAERGDYEGALACWTRLSGRHPQHRRLALNISRLYYLLGRDQLTSGDLRGGLSSWLKFAEMHDDDEDLWRDIGEVRFRIARAALLDPDESRLAESERFLDEAQELLPESARILFYRGLLDLRGGDIAGGSQNLSRAAGLDDSLLGSVSMLWLGLAHICSHDHSEAIRTVGPLAVEDNPGVVPQLAKHTMAVANARMGDWRKAADLARIAKCEQVCPDSERIGLLAEHLPHPGSVVDYNAVIEGITPASGISSPYYSGVQRAINGDLDGARSLLEEACMLPESEAAGAMALAEVYRCMAERELAGNEIACAASLLGKAQSLDPESPRIASLLDAVGMALPVFHVLAGSRDAACRVWTDALQGDDPDITIAHSLALLYYWRGMGCIGSDQPSDAAEAFERSGECFSMVLRSPDFHERLVSDRSAVYGKQIEQEDVEVACRQMTGSVLRTIAGAADGFRKRGAEVSAQVMMHAYGIVLGELRAAEMLADAVRILDRDAPEGLRIGGPGALARYGGLGPAQEAVRRVGYTAMDREVAAKLEVAFSGRAPEWGLIEARLFDQVVEDLTRPGYELSSEQTEILARACFELGVLAKDDSGSERAFELWVRALETLGDRDSSISEEIGRHAEAAVKPIVENPSAHDIETVRRVVGGMSKLAEYLETPQFKMAFSTALHKLANAECRDGDGVEVRRLLEESLSQYEGNQAVRHDLSYVLTMDTISSLRRVADVSALLAGLFAGKPAEAVLDSTMTLARALDLDPNNHRAHELRSRLAAIISAYGREITATHIRMALDT